MMRCDKNENCRSRWTTERYRLIGRLMTKLILVLLSFYQWRNPRYFRWRIPCLPVFCKQGILLIRPSFSRYVELSCSERSGNYDRLSYDNAFNMEDMFRMKGNMCWGRGGRDRVRTQELQGGKRLKSWLLCLKSGADLKKLTDFFYKSYDAWGMAS